MKKTLLTLAICVASVATIYAQGTVNFASFGGGVNAPATSSLTGMRVEGTAFLAQLYFAPGVGASEDTLVAVLGTPAFFGTGSAAGYILTSTGGGTRSLTDGTTTVPGGGAATIQIRAWEAALGASFEEAMANAPANTDRVLGRSNLVDLNSTGNPAASPPVLAVNLVGLNPYMLMPIPEPSVLALAGLAAGALLLLRRRK